MNERPTLPYGSWPSPISPEMAVGSARGLSEPIPDGDDIYLLESRPEEAGRVVLLRRTPDGVATDMAPGLNVRTRVHEYGGGAYTVSGGCLVFSEFVDNRLMLKRTPHEAPAALVSDPSLRFADLELDLERDRVIAVLEDQRESAIGARNVLCAVSLANGAITDLASGHDFYSDPRLSPDGRQLAWVSWDFPQMPWDGTDLWVAPILDDGSLGEAVHVAGGTRESVVQPRWAPDGSLVFISDRSDWFNLYRWRAGSADAQALAPMEAEFAGPQWVFGLSDYGIDADGTVVASSFAMGEMRLWALRAGEAPRDLGVSADEIDDVRVRDGVVTLIGAFATRPRVLMTLDLRDGGEEHLREAASLAVDAELPLRPTPHRLPDLRWPHRLRLVLPAHQPRRGRPGGRGAAARGHVPRRSDEPGARGPEPRAAGLHEPRLRRGGRRLRRLHRLRSALPRPLREQWGIVDVDDCTNVALWLAEQGLADRRRLAIRGGSAGGYTTLAALCFKDVFTAGTSFYGLGDLEAFAKITHKFESRYMDILVGPYPETAERYRERSPDRHADRISCPVLVMQGADDKIVPPSQAEGIVAALARNGLPHAYLLFEGEGHGFRQAAQPATRAGGRALLLRPGVGLRAGRRHRAAGGSRACLGTTDNTDRRADARRSAGAGRGGGSGQASAGAGEAGTSVISLPASLPLASSVVASSVATAAGRTTMRWARNEPSACDSDQTMTSVPATRSARATVSGTRRSRVRPLLPSSTVSVPSVRTSVASSVVTEAVSPVARVYSRLASPVLPTVPVSVRRVTTPSAVWKMDLVPHEAVHGLGEHAAQRAAHAVARRRSRPCHPSRGRPSDPCGPCPCRGRGSPLGRRDALTRRRRRR